ncbi:A-kinase anchor protein 7 isoform gamma [Plakobranchus ocellatus]|uniref:A-kinase anchor protein 7 isoform gamma n=1 Tax=Plakobranchus ocellatus TaxID=259542 RepID=A0AAV3Y3N4_9GAST|nr:A-kinase anchor protein 7 isoform gamma [Plakobranchus ocellatus]
MAGGNMSSEITDLDVISRDQSCKPCSHAAKLRGLYPQCTISETIISGSHTLLLIQMHDEIDLKLEFKIPNNGLKALPSVAVLSKSLTKKDVQRLQRSAELHLSTSNLLEEVVQIAFDFIAAESLCARNEPPLNKRKKKKNKAYKDGDRAEDVEEKCSDESFTKIKTKGKRSKRRSRSLHLKDDGSEDDDNENFAQGMEFISPFQDQSWEAPCSSLALPARPTHFLAVRVTSKTIVDQLSSVQCELVAQEPLLTKGVFSPDIFHLTLFTLGLDSEEDVDNCICALRTMRPGLEQHRPVEPFVIYGISQFYNRAVFAKVLLKQDFRQFREYLKDQLIHFNVEIRDQYENFNPHVTIIKVKRPERKLFGTRNIQPAIYSHLKDTVFGEQKLEDIHLCPMDGQRGEDGFYSSLFSIRF